MIGKFTKGRVYVFIDAENVFYTQRTLGWKISYEKLIQYLQKECGGDVKCFLYTGKDDGSRGQQKFLDMLEINGYVVRTKSIKKIRRHDGTYKWKNNLDIELAFEMFRIKERYDTLILFSGDSDFSTPLDALKYEEHKTIIACSTRGHISKELLERADKYIDLKKLRGEISREDASP